jgi:hypothetical protein
MDVSASEMNLQGGKIAYVLVDHIFQDIQNAPLLVQLAAVMIQQKPVIAIVDFV